MRCVCCNANLSDYESVLKHPDTMEYLDICKRCLVDIPITPLEPTSAVEDISYEDDDYEDLTPYVNGINDDDF